MRFFFFFTGKNILWVATAPTEINSKNTTDINSSQFGPVFHSNEYPIKIRVCNSYTIWFYICADCEMHMVFSQLLGNTPK